MYVKHEQENSSLEKYHQFVFKALVTPEKVNDYKFANNIS